MTYEELIRLLRLDPETGRLFWRERPESDFKAGRFSARRNCKIWNTKYAGNEAMTAVSHGYRCGNLMGVHRQAHRLVFAIANGRAPSWQVDHIDGDRLNNRPGNLREATNKENARNGRSRGGSSRYKGVSWSKVAGKWTAQSMVDGRKVHLGSFATEADAAKAYDEFALGSFGAFARVNFPVSA